MYNMVVYTNNINKLYIYYFVISGNTALMIAIKHDSPSVSAILTAGADFAQCNSKTERTGLHIAAAYERPRILHKILNSHTHPKFINKTDNHGDTAFMIAVQLGFLNIIQCFLKLRKPHLIHVNQKTACSTLHMAVFKDRADILKPLLNVFTNVLSYADSNGRSPMLLAAELNSLNCFNCLLPTEDTYSQNARTRETLLHVIMRTKNTSLLHKVSQLKTMNWFLKQKDRSKLTFYWTAIKYGNDECLKMFLKKGWIDVNELNDDGDSLMFVAVKYGHLNVLKALLLSSKYYRFCKKYENKFDINNPRVLTDAEVQGDIYKTDVFILLGIKPSQQTHRWLSLIHI